MKAGWRAIGRGLLGACVLLTALVVQAQDVSLASLPTVTGPLIKDRDFRELPVPVRTSVPAGDVEIVAFFHYGSPWSAQVAPYVQAWVNGPLDPRIHVQWAPAVLADDWGWGARVFFALDQIGQADSLNPSLMAAYASGALAYGDTAQLVQWLYDHRADSTAFSVALNDGKVIARTAWVPNVMGLYQVRTVPTFVINGRYVLETDSQTPPLLVLARVRYIASRLLERGPEHTP